MRKRVLLLLLTVVYLLSASATTAAENVIKIYLLNQPIQTDTPPQIINGRVMVPIRAVSEAFGCTVTWDQDNKIVKITPPQITMPPEPKITGDENFISDVKDALYLLKRRNLDAYYFVCYNLKEIKTSYKHDVVAWEDNGVCYFNPYNLAEANAVEMALYLCHEAAHAQVDATGLTTTFDINDREHIAYLYMYRIAKQLGATQYTTDIANRMLQSLKP